MLLVVMASFIASAEPPAVVQAECDCHKLEVLQIELRNALHLQQAFRNKIAELRTMNVSTSKSALDKFAKEEAPRVQEPVPGYKGPKAFDYVSWGDAHTDPDHPGNHTDAELCAFSEDASDLFNRAKQASGCAGIAAALEAHEQVHINTCLRIHYRPYLTMHGADRAQEEVDAYGAQIAVLRAEIGRVLDQANLRVKLEVNTRLQMPSNPLYTAIVLTNQAEVPVKLIPASGPLGIRFTGDSDQIMSGKIEGNCRFSSGLPSKLPVHVTVDSDGLEAQISYTVSGTQGSVGMECTLPQGSGRGMSMPVPMNNASNYPPIKLKLANGEKLDFDMSSGQAAQIMSQGGAKLTGLGTMTLIWDCSSGN
jgi:hypothetical protein